MKRSDIIKSKFPEFKGVVDVETTDSQINFIDVLDNRIEFTFGIFDSLFPGSLEVESDQCSIDDFVDEMDEEDFNNLIKDMDNRS